MARPLLEPRLRRAAGARVWVHRDLSPRYVERFDLRRFAAVFDLVLVREAERAGRRLRVRVNCVLMRDNFRRLPELVRLAGELGCVDVVPMPVDGASGAHRLSRRQMEVYNCEVAPRVQAARAAHGFPLRSERTHPYGVTDRDLRYCRAGRYARGVYERQPCYAPWLHTFVARTGEVYPCCMAAGLTRPLGNVRAAPLRAVLTGERARALRRDFLAGRLLPPCHRCDQFVAENRLLEEARRARTAKNGTAKKGTGTFS